MLNYVVLFFVLAVVSAFLGFGNLAGTFSQAAQILTVVFLASLAVSLARHFLNKP